MEEYNNISRFDIEEKLSKDNFRINRIISSALLAGTFIFLVIVVLLYLKNMNSNPASETEELIKILIIVLLIYSIAIYSIVLIFPKIYLKKENIIKRLSQPAVDWQKRETNDPILKLIGIDRTLMIIRLAMLEGVTLFGFVILMISVLNNTIYTNDYYWLLVFPWLVQVAVTYIDYFSKEKVVERIYTEILLKVKE